MTIWSRAFDIRRMSEIRIEEVHETDFATELHSVLSEAFEPYRNFYTPEAFAQTILTPQIIAHRIISDSVHVLAAFRDSEIAGTVSLRKKNVGELYFQSMGVKPSQAGKGIGGLLLKKIEEIAIEKGCAEILLDTFYALTPAIRLYEKFGFKKTGIEHEWGGVTIFEMRKYLSG